MKRIVLFIMPLIAMLLGMNACKGNDPVQPAEKKARYTIMAYGNARGSMDSYIEHLWERTNSTPIKMRMSIPASTSKPDGETGSIPTPIGHKATQQDKIYDSL